MNLKLLLQTLGLFAVFYLGNFFSCSNNRKQLKEDYYAVIALRKRTSGDVDYEEDLSFLGVKSADELTIFSRLQTRGAVIHSRSYKRVQGEITTLWFIRRETALVAKDVPRMHIHS